MKNVLLLKSIKYFKNRHNNKQQGFTLLELLVVFLIIGVLAAIALPSLLKQADKARISEAKNTLGMLNRAQQAYYFEKSYFASSFSDLGADIVLGSALYDYSFVNTIDNTQVSHLATPQTKYLGDLSYITSAVFRAGGNFNYVVCQGDSPNIVPEIVDSTTCNNGTIVN